MSRFYEAVPWERIRSQMWRERRERGPPIRSAKQRATTTRYAPPLPSSLPPRALALSVLSHRRNNKVVAHISGYVKTHCADVSFPRKFQPSVIMNGYGLTCSKALMGQIARVETLSLSVAASAGASCSTDRRHLWFVAQIATNSWQVFAGFFSSSPLYLSLDALSLLFLFFFFFPLFFWRVVLCSAGCLCFIGGATRARATALPLSMRRRVAS